MDQEKTYDKCKYFSYQECPYINDETMKRATQTPPESHSGTPVTMSFPTDDEINKICKNCDKFTQE